VRDEEEPVLQVVEGDDVVEEAEPPVRQADRVAFEVREPLEPADRVVSDVADRPAGERRVVVTRLRAETWQGFQRGERIFVGRRDFRSRRRAEE